MHVLHFAHESMKDGTPLKLLFHTDVAHSVRLDICACPAVGKPIEISPQCFSQISLPQDGFRWLLTFPANALKSSRVEEQPYLLLPRKPETLPRKHSLSNGGRIAVLHSHPAIVLLVRIKTARAVGDAQRERPLETAYRSRGQLCPPYFPVHKEGSISI
ncbi:hypothetical protein L211DRAFT_411118 [Terfezia boudieri ATCC MYA-4762]|uniref:Uncharacterized protein n=1 Tax=Terfezia boudieri ATCC MYA-4762 TaxID=1051890 RepID=A0A3N4LMK4_9PEZI|nr:hypothetical protein L211DRAFT_411118 [Terfezia boudieri ATCC MYA-4762]